MATASDNFNRADGGIGANWTQDSGTWTIVSNTARQTVAGSQYRKARYTATAPATNDHEATTSGIAPSSGNGFGVGIRLANSSALSGYAVVGFGNDAFYLLSISAGTETILVTGPTCTAGTTYTIRLQAVGTTIRWWLDGTEQTGATSSTFTSGGWGIWSFGDLNASTALIDNWSATDVSSGGSVQVDDTGSGSDAASGVLTATIADTGTGSDTTSGALAATVADTGNGSDTITGFIAATIADTGTGTDTPSALILVTLADTGSGADTVSAQLLATFADTASAADAVSGALIATLGDTGSGADAASVPGGSSVQVDDTASGTDTVSALILATLPDTGIGTDATSGASATTLNDAGSALDALSGALAWLVVDTGSGVDTVLAALLATLADTAAGTDAVSIPSSGTPRILRLSIRQVVLTLDTRERDLSLAPRSTTLRGD